MEGKKRVVPGEVPSAAETEHETVVYPKGTYNEWREASRSHSTVMTALKDQAASAVASVTERTGL